MKFHAIHFRSLLGHDYACVVGIAGGRVPYYPEATWLYSLRLMLGLWKVELLWTTGGTPQ